MLLFSLLCALFSITALFVFVFALILFACLYVITIGPLVRIKITIILHYHHHHRRRRRRRRRSHHHHHHHHHVSLL